MVSFLEEEKMRWKNCLRGMMFIRWLLVLIALAFTMGCSPNPVTTKINMPGSGPWGSIKIRFSVAVENISVVVDGKMAVDKAETDTITVTGIPVGAHHLRVIGGGAMQVSTTYDEDVNVTPGDPTVVMLKAPEVSSAGRATQVTLLVLTAIAASVPWFFVIAAL